MLVSPIIGFLLGGIAVAPSPAWDEPIQVARCDQHPPSLPGETDDALDATLLVRTERGTGSAVLISADGFALTAAHVVGDAAEVDVLAHDAQQLRATVVRVDELQDVALLRVERAEPFVCLPLAVAPTPLGSDTFILGSPGGEELSFSVSKGIVSAYRDFGGVRFVQLDASVNPGNSGGPAVDDTGHVIGIASWKVSHVSMEGLAFAVPIDVGRDALGVEFATVSSQDWRRLRGRITAQAEGSSELPTPSRSASTFDAKAIARQQAKRSLIVWGATSLGLGLVPVVTTAVLARKEDHIPTGSWNALRAVNTVGWTLSIAGTGLLAVGIALPKKKSRKAEVALVPRIDGASIAGRF